MQGSGYTIIKKLIMIVWMCFFAFSIVVGCSSCSKDEPAQTTGSYDSAADSAAAGNEERMAEINQRIEGMENEPEETAARQRAEAARSAEADPRNIPYGSSKEFEFNTSRPLDILNRGYGKYTGVEFFPTDCLASAGIRASFENISESDTSAKISYSVHVDELGQGGAQVLLESLRGCKTRIRMDLILESYEKQKGVTPMFLGLRFSENGVHVDEPRAIR